MMSLSWTESGSESGLCLRKTLLTRDAEYACRMCNVHMLGPAYEGTDQPSVFTINGHGIALHPIFGHSSAGLLQEHRLTVQRPESKDGIDDG